MHSVKFNFILAVIITLLLSGIYAAGELWYVKNAGDPVAAPKIPRQTKTYGKGELIKYAVMGDSTAISQGSDYDDGFAVASAKHLAKNNQVRMINTGISGATAQEVVAKQLTKATVFRPDIVLLSVGANDATAFTSSSSIKKSLKEIAKQLEISNPNVQIVVTGSPAMDSVSRFPPLSKRIMAIRTLQINGVFARAIDKYDLVFAPIAKETRQAFLDDPTLTAADKFHPNKRGYALWIPVINKAVDEAVDRSL